MRLQLVRKSLNMDIRLWLGGELLSVSWWCNVSLKSQAKSQGKVCEEAKEVRSSQSSVREAKSGLTYMVDKIQLGERLVEHTCTKAWIAWFDTNRISRLVL